MLQRFGFYRLLFYECLCWLVFASVTGLNLTITPSRNVEVNQSVTLHCELDPNPPPPVVVIFSLQSPFTTLCVVEPWNGECKNTPDPCRNLYNASCPSDTRYSIQVKVPMDWNGASVVCETFFERSNSIIFSVNVPVSSVNLTQTTIVVSAGQMINLTCVTSYSNPAATISWHKSSEDITPQSTSETLTKGSLVRTISSLRSIVVKEDNGKQIYCRANNTMDASITSSMRTIIVLYKPEVSSSLSNPYRVIEGETATLLCTVTDANPNTNITWRWVKINSTNDVLHTGRTYTIPNIKRDRSGSYICRASNKVGTSEGAVIDIDVLCM
ncbi:cell adhesion molecule 2-like isoform X3 [Crassostrea virginica]